jgi:hypothetical protein
LYNKLAITVGKCITFKAYINSALCRFSRIRFTTYKLYSVSKEYQTDQYKVLLDEKMFGTWDVVDQYQ